MPVSAGGAPPPIPYDAAKGRSASSETLMLPAILTVSLSIMAGACLAFFGIAERRRLAASIDSFALIACLAVVLGHLLPHSIASLGLVALMPFALALGLPALLEWTLERRASHSGHGAAGHGAALELSYLGLLVHQFGDGLGLGVFSSGEHEGHLHLDLLVGIGAHTVPIATLMTRAFLRQRGPRAATFRALGLIIAGVLGVAFAHRLPADLLSHADPWLTAAIGGLLLHIVVHDPRSPEERLRPSRLAELFALLFGLALLFLGGGYDHAHAAEPAGGSSIGGAVLEILGVISAPLLIGLVALFALRRLFPERAESLGGALERSSLPSKSLFLCAIALAALLEPLAWLILAAALAAAARLATPLGLRPEGGHLERGVAVQLALGVLIATYLTLAAASAPSQQLSSELTPWMLIGAIALAFPRAPLLILPIGLALSVISGAEGALGASTNTEAASALGPLVFGLALTLSIDAPALLRARSPRLIFGFFYALLLGQLAALGGAAFALRPSALSDELERILAGALLALFFLYLLRAGTRALISELFGETPHEAPPPIDEPELGLSKRS